MAFNSQGADVALVRTANGRMDFDMDTSFPNKGNPRYTDDNVHRVFSLLVEHRASSGLDGGIGWMWDENGIRGSLIYTVKNVKRATPSQLEAFALDAMAKGVNEGWFTNPTAKAYLSPITRARIEVGWTNPGGRAQAIKVPLSVGA